MEGKTGNISPTEKSPSNMLRSTLRRMTRCSLLPLLLLSCSCCYFLLFPTGFPLVARGRRMRKEARRSRSRGPGTHSWASPGCPSPRVLVQGLGARSRGKSRGRSKGLEWAGARVSRSQQRLLQDKGAFLLLQARGTLSTHRLLGDISILFIFHHHF